MGGAWKRCAAVSHECRQFQSFTVSYNIRQHWKKGYGIIYCDCAKIVCHTFCPVFIMCSWYFLCHFVSQWKRSDSESASTLQTVVICFISTPTYISQSDTIHITTWLVWWVQIPGMINYNFADNWLFTRLIKYRHIDKDKLTLVYLTLFLVASISLLSYLSPNLIDSLQVATWPQKLVQIIEWSITIHNLR